MAGKNCRGSGQSGPGWILEDGRVSLIIIKWKIKIDREIVRLEYLPLLKMGKELFAELE